MSSPLNRRKRLFPWVAAAFVGPTVLWGGAILGGFLSLEPDFHPAVHFLLGALAVMLYPSWIMAWFVMGLGTATALAVIAATVVANVVVFGCTGLIWRRMNKSPAFARIGGTLMFHIVICATVFALGCRLL